MTTRGVRVQSRKAGLGLAAAVLAWVAITPLTALASNDPLYAQQWGLTGAPASINAPQAWCGGTGGVLVADVDTGADFGHSDLQGRLVPGAAFTGGSGATTGSGQGAVGDGYGHGTMTVGLIVANKDNGVGIAGIAPASQALVVKVFDNNGNGYTNDAAAGIDYAVNQGAQVINLSLAGNLIGMVVGTDPIGPAISNAISNGRMVAVAAGNNGLPFGDYANRGALVVGALSPNGTIASYSNNLIGVDIYAPGGDGSGGGSSHDVLSTFKGNSYTSEAGTSFAAPHVAGTLALLMSKGYSAGGARARILATANSATGGVDAAAAMGSSGGCSGAPPTTNNPATAAPGAYNGRPGSGRRPGTTASTANPAPASPSPSPSPSESPSPLLAVASTGGPGVATGTILASAPPSQPGPPVLLAVPVLLLGTAIGYGAGWGLIKGIRLRLVQPPGDSSG